MISAFIFPIFLEFPGNGIRHRNPRIFREFPGKPKCLKTSCLIWVSYKKWIFKFIYWEKNFNKLKYFWTHYLQQISPTIAKSYAGQQNASAWVPANCTNGKKGKRWKPCSANIAYWHRLEYALRAGVCFFQLCENYSLKNSTSNFCRQEWIENLSIYKQLGQKHVGDAIFIKWLNQSIKTEFHVGGYGLKIAQ